ncbi:MAG: GlsB/YeaQ/YmgE family stress response membrane protein [Planctomycetales bacterium]|nr:GlsB/YeaQ/YmgE family stress response membrane protein [Planctomycetales bacterium]
MNELLPPEFQAWFEYILLWIGFGTFVGLTAKAIMPGRDPGGAVATLLMGITGVVIGCGVYTLATNQKVSPVSLVGLLVGTAGAFVILLFYRMLDGYVLNEAGSRGLGQPRRPQRRRTTRRRRRRPNYQLADYYDD